LQVKNKKMKTQTTITPFEGYQLMLEDYRGSLDGSIPPINVDEFIEPDSPENNTLSQLRRTVSSFAIDQVGLGIEQVARGLNLSPEVLEQDIRHDEKLIHLTEAYREQAFNPETTVDTMVKVNLDRIGWVQQTGELSLHTKKLRLTIDDLITFQT
jgi:hypothetical protein